jgi:sodium/proline symporter
MGPWVTAFSAQASDMSGWLLMGLPGAMYLGGMPETWIAIGLFIGTVVNWYLVSSRLRVYTERTDSITLSSFLENRFKDPTGSLRIISAMIILIFFTIYASSGIVAAGRLFEALFGIDYHLAAIVGTVIIVVYTFLGGFLAVCWTDLFQGSLMIIAIVVVPVLGVQAAGGIDQVIAAMHSAELPLSLIGPGGVLAIISAAAWGLGYFGQPHILARFMSIKSIKQLPQARIIAVVWVFFSLSFAVGVGLVAVGMFEGLAGGDQEKVFILMVRELFNPWIGGILLAAILSAIMSTIDSQLLVSSSALTEDFYKKVLRTDADEKSLIWIGRICVVIISFIALLLAMNPNNTVLGLVSYAWGGFGAAFGPVVLFALFSRKTTWKSALIGMILGTVTTVVWKQIGLGATLYEIVPGFLANCVAIGVVNLLVREPSEEIMREFDQVHAEVTS